MGKLTLDSVYKYALVFVLILFVLILIGKII
jgi:hypothetical protein